MTKPNSRAMALAKAFKRRQQTLRGLDRRSTLQQFQIQPRMEETRNSLSENLSSNEGLSLSPNETIQDKKRKRGPTMCNNVHGRTEDEREEIILNEAGQPIGPNNAVVTQFTNFVGSVARKVNILPLTISSWKDVSKEKKKELWEYVLKHYDVPLEGKGWVLTAMNDSWRSYKCRLKRDHYFRYDNDDDRKKNRPKRIPKKLFRDMLKIWNSESHKKVSARNKKNCLVQKEKNIRHTAGPRSFARIKEDWKKENKTDKDPSLAEMFIETRKEKITKRKGGDQRDKIINELQQSNNERNESSDIETSIASIYGFESDKRRRLRLYGRGVSYTHLKLKAKQDQDRQAMAAEYEEKRQKDREELANGLREILSQLKEHCPNMTFDPKKFGSLLIGDPLSGDATIVPNALQKSQVSTSSRSSKYQAANIMGGESSDENDENEDA